MKETIKNLSERMDVLEKRIDIMMSMINHMNNILAENTIQKIEIDFEEAVNKKIEFMKNESNENSL
jgi:hypothetical protein